MDEPCVEDGGYVKLRELSVAYSFDGPWVARLLGLTTLDVRVSEALAELIALATDLG